MMGFAALALTLAAVLVFAIGALEISNSRSVSPPPNREPIDLEREAERIDAERFAEHPLAFWNDPHRYGGKRLEERIGRMGYFYSTSATSSTTNYVIISVGR